MNGACIFEQISNPLIPDLSCNILSSVNVGMTTKMSSTTINTVEKCRSGLKLMLDIHHIAIYVEQVGLIFFLIFHLELHVSLVFIKLVINWINLDDYFTCILQTQRSEQENGVYWIPQYHDVSFQWHHFCTFLSLICYKHFY